MKKIVGIMMFATVVLSGLTVWSTDIGIYNAALGGGKNAGARAIKTTLGESKMSVEEFSKMSMKNLLKYKVIIIPNTKRLSKNEGKKWSDNLRAYVADCGGAIVFFHDAVGAKRSPFGMLPLFPEIVDLRTVERVESKEVQVAIDPLLADFQYLPNYGIKQTVKHMYDDHFTFICLNGKTLLSDIKTKKAVVAVGEVGKGRVVFDGMWGGKTTGQAGRLEGIDKDVFLNTVKWCLAGKGLTVTDAAKVTVKEWKHDVKGSSKSSNKVALIYGENYEGSAEIAKEKITNSGIDYDFIPMHFLPVRGLDSKDYKLIIAFLQAGRMQESKEAFDKIKSYLEGGGKAIIFLPPYGLRKNNGKKLLEMIGSKPLKSYNRRMPEVTNIRRIIFEDSKHKPAEIENSLKWGINDISKPEAGKGEIIAYWANEKGEKKFPAIIKTGFGYLVNNNTYGDPSNNDMFIANAVIEILPEIKEKVFANLVKIFEKQNTAIKKEDLSSRGKTLYTAAEQLKQAAEKAAGDKNYISANSLILQGKDSLVKAFSTSMPSVKGKKRMVFTVAKGLDPDSTCKRLCDAGFTGIAIVHLGGYYPSELYARKDDGKIDWMQKWVDSAHKYGLKIGPSFNTFCVYKGSKEFEQGVKEDWRVVPANSYGKEPKPYKKNMYKIGFCRSHKEVSDYAIKKSLEILKKYSVDYVFYDGIRWSDTCYCDHCRKGFEKDTGLKINNWPDDAMDKYQNEYNDWRAKHVTKVIREASKNIAKINPKVKLGVYTFRGKLSAWAKGQYWWEWGNYVDYIMPMYYNLDNQFLEDLCKEINGLIPAGSNAKLVPCLAPSGYRTTSQFIMLQQIAIQQKYGPEGIMYFAYPFLSDSNLELLKMGPFRNK
jgi:glycosyl hydrolase family 10